jgi:hypothetical protein
MRLSVCADVAVTLRLSKACIGKQGVRLESSLDTLGERFGRVMAPSLFANCFAVLFVPATLTRPESPHCAAARQTMTAVVKSTSHASQFRSRRAAVAGNPGTARVPERSRFASDMRVPLFNLIVDNLNLENCSTLLTTLKILGFASAAVKWRTKE